MSNSIIRTQIFPDCNTTTKLFVDLFNQQLVINDLKFDLKTFKDAPISKQWLQFIDVKNYDIKGPSNYYDCVFDDERAQYVFNHKYNTPLHYNLTDIKFKSYAIIDDKYYYAPHNGYIWRYTLDGNALPQYSPKNLTSSESFFIFLKQIEDYLIWIKVDTWSTNNDQHNTEFYIHHKHNCRDYKTLQISNKFAPLVDFDDALNQITVIYDNNYHSRLHYKIIKLPESTNATEITVIEQSTEYIEHNFMTLSWVSSKAFNCDSLYDLGVYAIHKPTWALQLYNIDKVNKVMHNYDVNVNWNGFEFNATDANYTYVSNKYNSEITVGLMFNDSHFDLFRIKLTGDLEGICIAKTTFDLESESNDFRFQKLEFKDNKLVAITDLKTTKIFKYISEFKTFVELKTIGNNYLLFYNLSEQQIIVSELQYSSIQFYEISFDSEMRMFILNYPETMPKNDSNLITFALYDVIYEEYVPNIPVKFELTDGAVFRSNGKNSIEFLSQNNISTIEIKSLDESKIVELYYSI